MKLLVRLFNSTQLVASTDEILALKELSDQELKLVTGGSDSASSPHHDSHDVHEHHDPHGAHEHHDDAYHWHNNHWYAHRWWK